MDEYSNRKVLAFCIPIILALLGAMHASADFAFYIRIAIDGVSVRPIPGTAIVRAPPLLTMPFGFWNSLRWLFYSFLFTWTLACVLAFLQPSRVGSRLAWILGFWRVLIFVHRLLALSIIFWTILVGYLLVNHQVNVFVLRYSYVLQSKWDQARIAFGVFTVFSLILFVAARSTGFDLVKILYNSVAFMRFWFWARKQAKFMGPPYLPMATTEAIQVLIISDLHMTAPESSTVQRDFNDRVTRAFVNSAVQTLKPKLIIAAGDLTDASEEQAWEKVAALFSAFSLSIVAVPGNHDVNFKIPASRPTRWETLQAFFDLDDDLVGSYSESTIASRIRYVTSLGKRQQTFPYIHHDSILKLTRGDRLRSMTKLVDKHGL